MQPEEEGALDADEKKKKMAAVLARLVAAYKASPMSMEADQHFERERANPKQNTSDENKSFGAGWFKQVLPSQPALTGGVSASVRRRRKGRFRILS